MNQESNIGKTHNKYCKNVYELSVSWICFVFSSFSLFVLKQKQGIKIINIENRQQYFNAKTRNGTDVISYDSKTRHVQRQKTSENVRQRLRRTTNKPNNNNKTQPAVNVVLIYSKIKWLLVEMRYDWTLRDING